MFSDGIVSYFFFVKQIKLVKTNLFWKKIVVLPFLRKNNCTEKSSKITQKCGQYFCQAAECAVIVPERRFYMPPLNVKS